MTTSQRHELHRVLERLPRGAPLDDWDSLQQRLQFELPESYKRLVHFLGASQFGTFLVVTDVGDWRMEMPHLPGGSGSAEEEARVLRDSEDGDFLLYPEHDPSRDSYLLVAHTGSPLLLLFRLHLSYHYFEGEIEVTPYDVEELLYLALRRSEDLAGPVSYQLKYIADPVWKSIPWPTFWELPSDGFQPPIRASV
jgi:hypothetical protein